MISASLDADWEIPSLFSCHGDLLKSGMAIQVNEHVCLLKMLLLHYKNLKSLALEQHRG